MHIFCTFFKYNVLVFILYFCTYKLLEWHALYKLPWVTLGTLGLDFFVRDGCSRTFRKSCGHDRRRAMRRSGRGEPPQRLRLPPPLPPWSQLVAAPPPPPPPQPPGFPSKSREKVEGAAFQVSGLFVPWIERWQGIAVGTRGSDVPEQTCCDIKHLLSDPGKPMVRSRSLYLFSCLTDVTLADENTNLIL